MPKNKEILLISVGATPQVVTETLWYYTYNKIREFDEILLLTTSEGKKNIDKELFGKGRMRELELALSKPNNFFKVSSESIVVLKSDDGNDLSDIRTSKESEDMANHVFKILRGSSIYGLTFILKAQILIIFFIFICLFLKKLNSFKSSS